MHQGILLSAGLLKAEIAKSASGHNPGLAAGERTPTRPRPGDRVTLGSPGNSAFQPITASCKIVPQGQAPSPAESPGKSFQPITMSCKIVSGKCFLSVRMMNQILSKQLPALLRHFVKCHCNTLKYTTPLFSEP